MNFPQIRLQTERAMIEIRQLSGKQEIQQPPAVLTMEQPRATMTMESEPATLMIDQSKAWEDMNLYGPLKSTAKQASESKQAVLDGMARRAEQGSALMKLEQAGNPVVSQAIQNGHRSEKQVGITFIPSAFSVKLSSTPAQLDIRVEPNRPIIQAKTSPPNIQYERGKVDIRMKNYQHLDISFTNLLI
ncbi:hypothetical protein DX933_08630 [Ornithinibacillus gellani]|uniref:DUF6470 family protein n=1 Tax=Ornithinibacillus gellani TaxID=2293253 RepID=UPI000F48E291|nr:DUF6470 family protein [Ornithinibacillus gellani]TQS74829.1 hypothetical protein DX933_08630 [Ornithinibacillus gellani]